MLVLESNFVTFSFREVWFMNETVHMIMSGVSIQDRITALS